MPNNIKVGAVVPLSGPAGLYGPSCCNCISLAVATLNQGGGLLGRPLKTVFIDGGQTPIVVANHVKTFVEQDFFDIIVGFHDSDVRRAIVENCPLHIPYIYTPPYEGLEKAPAMFMLGETPQQQLEKIIPWLLKHHAANNWYLLGNDYSWPHKLNIHAREYIIANGGHVVGEHYVPFNTEDYSPYLQDLADANADIVLFSLVGNDACVFNRQFYAMGLASIQRYGPLMDENLLLGIGHDASDGIYSSSSYYPELKTLANENFVTKYNAAFSNDGAILTSLAQSCYEAFIFIKNLYERSQSLTLDAVASASAGMEYASPRGSLTMHDRHLIQDIHLAQAVDFRFEIVQSFPQVKP